jgi:hypothetical protein
MIVYDGSAKVASFGSEVTIGESSSYDKSYMKITNNYAALRLNNSEYGEQTFVRLRGSLDSKGRNKGYVEIGGVYSSPTVFSPYGTIQGYYDEGSILEIGTNTLKLSTSTVDATGDLSARSFTGKIRDNFTTASATISNQSLNHQTADEFYVTPPSKPGYTVIGIIGVDTNHDNVAFLTHWYWDGYQANIRLMNASGIFGTAKDWTDLQISVKFLYCK